jgi:hypothetical protein
VLCSKPCRSVSSSYWSTEALQAATIKTNTTIIKLFLWYPLATNGELGVPYYVYAIHTDDTNNRLYQMFDEFREADKFEREMTLVERCQQAGRECLR